MVDEHAQLRRQVFARRGVEVEAGERLLPVVEHADRAAGGDIGGDHRFESLRQTQPRQRGGVGQAAVVEHQGAGHFHLEIAAVAGELPGHAPAIAHALHDAAVFDQIGRGLRRRRLDVQQLQRLDAVSAVAHPFPHAFVRLPMPR